MLNTHQVAKKLGQNYFTFMRSTKHLPDFPKPFKLKENSQEKWRDEDIENYIKEKVAA